MPPSVCETRFSTLPSFWGECLNWAEKSAARHAQIRWFVVPQYRNYMIFYQPVEAGVLVIRILHAAQDWTRFFPPQTA